MVLMMRCADNGCSRSVSDSLYSNCFGCQAFFCDWHLLYCKVHENQHCETCCENGAAPAKGTEVFK